MALVFFLEDEAASALCMIELIQDRGHPVIHATDTDSALVQLAGINPDVLISDWAMDGSKTVVDVAMAVRQKNPAAKIIFTTGYSKEHIEGELKDLAPYEIYSKPLDFDKILDTI